MNPAICRNSGVGKSCSIRHCLVVLSVVVEAKKQDSVLYELHLNKQNSILSIATNLISLVPTLTSPHKGKGSPVYFRT